MWNKFLKLGLTSPIVSAGVVAKRKNPQSQQKTSIFLNH